MVFLRARFSVIMNLNKFRIIKIKKKKRVKESQEIIDIISIMTFILS